MLSFTSTLIFGGGGIVLLLLLSGLVSGSEVAFFSLTDNDYEDFAESPTPASLTLIDFRERPRQLLATILIANNFINIAIVLISEVLLRALFPESIFTNWATGILSFLDQFGLAINPEGYFSAEPLAGAIRFTVTVVGVTFLLVLFGEVAPKVYARMNRVELASLMARPVNFLMSLFKPVSVLLVNGASIIERRLESHTNDNFSPTQQDIDEAIDLTVQQEENGEESQQDVFLLKQIVLFANVTVRQIMRSRGDVVAVDQSANYHELLDRVREHSYSRIPVFEDDFDKVRGILYVKDLLGYRYESADFDWLSLVRQEVLYVPENKKVSDLLKEFQQQKMHMAIVVDEYGGTEGIVTLEDVMEEVIGDIQDEFDEGDEIVFNKIDDYNFEFDGKTLLNDVCRVLDLSTTTFDELKGEAESLAGIILETIGHFPEPGQEIKIGEYTLKPLSVTSRRIEEVLITLPETSASEEGED
ncbi:hypothetical protein A3850_004805 [Lewinella sp. 4G2]|nr:hypothetical protein A3850_004805 [Lewinella sp. 4G2]